MNEITIQVIGKTNTGKTTIATCLEAFLQGMGFAVDYAPLHGQKGRFLKHPRDTHITIQEVQEVRGAA
jgi:molybdopterin-guanine dinucleotide biosynthesis protein